MPQSIHWLILLHIIYSLYKGIIRECSGPSKASSLQIYFISSKGSIHYIAWFEISKHGVSCLIEQALSSRAYKSPADAFLSLKKMKGNAFGALSKFASLKASCIHMITHYVNILTIIRCHTMLLVYFFIWSALCAFSFKMTLMIFITEMPRDTLIITWSRPIAAQSREFITLRQLVIDGHFLITVLKSSF